jgi:hypothetical protein
MSFLPGRNQVGTVRGARITTALAGSACRSARIAHAMMTLVFGVGLLLFLSLREPGRFHRHKRCRRYPRQSKFSSSHHDRDPCSKDEMDVSVDELRWVASCGQIRESTPNYTRRRAAGSTGRKTIRRFRIFPQIKNFGRERPPGKICGDLRNLWMKTFCRIYPCVCWRPLPL